MLPASMANFEPLRETTGSPWGNLDLMIGAHALAAGLTLVTNDRLSGESRS